MGRSDAGVEGLMFGCADERGEMAFSHSSHSSVIPSVKVLERRARKTLNWMSVRS